jgi:hypothetical protein
LLVVQQQLRQSDAEPHGKHPAVDHIGGHHRADDHGVRDVRRAIWIL